MIVGYIYGGLYSGLGIFIYMYMFDAYIKGHTNNIER